MWELNHKRRLSAEELRLLNCGVEDSWVPWTRSNQSILKEIGHEYQLEGLMLKLKLQYFGHLMWRTDSFEKTLMLGKTEAGRRGDNRGWDGWMVSPTQWAWVWVNSRSWWWTGRPGVLQSMGSQRVGHDWGTELNWTVLGADGHHQKEGGCQSYGPKEMNSSSSSEVGRLWALDKLQSQHHHHSLISPWAENPFDHCLKDQPT